MNRSLPQAAGAERRLDVDVAGLERALRSAVDGEVRFDRATRAVYSTDASNYRQIPIGAVVPRSADAVVSALGVCHAFGAPVFGRGGGTSLAGQCTNVGVVFDFSKYMNRTLRVDPENKRVVVEPGAILDAVRVPLQEKERLTIGPDPATHTHCTLGGMIGNNSCGVHSVTTGRTVDNVERLEVVTYDGTRLELGPTSEAELERIIAAGGRKGEIFGGLRALRERHADLIRARYPDIPRRVSGFNLPELLPERGFHVARALVGTESTCALTLSATLRLVDWPPGRALVVVGCRDIYVAADLTPRVLEHGPVGLEGVDDKLVEFMRKKDLHPKDLQLLPEGRGWLLVEFGGESDAEAAERGRAFQAALEGEDAVVASKLYDDREEAERVWEIRESGLGATAYVPNMEDAWPGWEDAAVPPARVGDYLREFRGLLDKYRYDCALYGHFGDGCIHCRITFDLMTQEGLRKYSSFIGEAADLVVSHGGALSGEHGDGQARGVLLEKMYGPELVGAFREFKRIWDPEGKMNPGKVVDAGGPTQNLKLGADYDPIKTETYFSYPEDNGDFAHATLRCVGVGKCRRTHDAFMCPSFLATREEQDTTRGRARALFEMLQGDVVEKVWKDEAVLETLDLCIGCKGCKGECPVHVDMATYKAEFQAHYYKGKLRPRAHYAMGWIDRWAKLASKMPGVVNWLTGTRPFERWGKWVAGVAQERSLPKFAAQPFTTAFRGDDAGARGKRVVLLADVFNNYFFPEALHAAVEVLRRSGFAVELPGKAMGGIRPRIHYGMLKGARRQMVAMRDALTPYVRAGVDVVGIEPSTVSVFRDEMHSMFPHDPDAMRLRKHCMLLSEFLVAREVELPEVGGKAIFHGHCHQKAVLEKRAARDVLARMGLEVVEPQPGCCGMAGSFGYEAGEHYEVSMKIGEEQLLPAVREASAETVVIVEGFSCREQIMHGTDREPVHLAQAVANALRGKPLGERGAGS